MAWGFEPLVDVGNHRLQTNQQMVFSTSTPQQLLFRQRLEICQFKSSCCGVLEKQRRRKCCASFFGAALMSAGQDVGRVQHRKSNSPKEQPRGSSCGIATSTVGNEPATHLFAGLAWLGKLCHPDQRYLRECSGYLFEGVKATYGHGFEHFN